MPSDLTTLSQHAYHAMKQLIVQGELSAGQWLRKRGMASRLRMSATPVVEALRRLEYEGLVQTEPQWGARVRVFTVPELFELATMRVALEGAVAACCARTLTDEQIAALRPLARHVDSLDKPLSDRDHARALGPGAVANEDMDFHQRLADEAGLPLMRREIERLQVLKATCRMHLLPAIRATITHEQILDAIASRDPAQAESTMRKHIQENVDAYIPALRERFGDGPVIWNASNEKSA